MLARRGIGRNYLPGPPSTPTQPGQPTHTSNNRRSRERETPQHLPPTQSCKWELPLTGGQVTRRQAEVEHRWGGKRHNASGKKKTPKKKKKNKTKPKSGNDETASRQTESVLGLPTRWMVRLTGRKLPKSSSSARRRLVKVPIR